MTEEVTDAIELLARLEEIGGNKAGAFTLRSVGAVGTLYQAKLEAVTIALRGLTINYNPFTPEEEAELVDQINGSYYLQPNSPTTNGEVSETLDDIAAMMSEFVDNWPQPKKIKTALALVAKTMRAALDPPQHVCWMAGEPDCPRELKAGNGELHTLRCKVCGLDNPRSDACRANLTPRAASDDEAGKLKEALAQIGLIAGNGSGWFENDTWAGVSEIFQIAQLALSTPTKASIAEPCSPTPITGDQDHD